MYNETSKHWPYFCYDFIFQNKIPFNYLINMCKALYFTNLIRVQKTFRELNLILIGDLDRFYFKYF